MTIALRPTFSMRLSRPSQEVLAQAFVRLSGAAVQVRRAQVPGGGGSGAARERDHFVLTVPEQERRFWSPWLTVDVSPMEGGAHVFCRFMPHPSVWTAFVFAYLSLGVAVLFSLVFTFALVMTGGPPWTLFITAGAIGCMVLLWCASQLGQRWASEQMATLRDLAEFAVADDANDDNTRMGEAVC